MRLFLFLLALQYLFESTAYADLARAIWVLRFLAPTSNTSPSSTAISSTGPGTSPPILEKSPLTCHPGFPMAKSHGSATLVEACTSMERKTTQLMKHLNGGEVLLRYVDPAIPDQLNRLAYLAFMLEHTHDCCQTSDRDGTYCTWLSQLTSELLLLRVKIGGSDEFRYWNVALQSFILDLRGVGQRISQIPTNLAAYLSAPFSFLRNALTSSPSPGPDGASDRVEKANEVPQA